MHFKMEQKKSIGMSLVVADTFIYMLKNDQYIYTAATQHCIMHIAYTTQWGFMDA